MKKTNRDVFIAAASVALFIAIVVAIAYWRMD